MAVVYAMYTRDTNFDMDYYLQKHMPMVADAFASMGFKGWKVIAFDDPNVPYKVMAIMEWDHNDSWKKARASDASKPVFDDVPVFSDKPPVIWDGITMGHS